MDGKQTSPRLLNESEGDVNLWGYEGPPSLEENLECLQENVIIEVVNKASREDSDFKDVVNDLKIIVHVITKCIKNL